MFKKFIISSIALLLFFQVSGQKNQKLPPGFPDRSPGMNVLPGFIQPPKGYGEVSFYWWIGDTLTHDRILWQLDQLKDKGITGLQINYCHTDKGGATYGLTYPSQPALFSPKWWELLQWFLKEAKKRDMSVSLSDYTLGAAGQGWFVDEMLKENPGLHGTKLESKQFDILADKEFKTTVPTNILTAVAYENVNGSLNASNSIDLLPRIKDGELTWKAPSGKWKVLLIYKNEVKTSFDPMNPLSGPKVAEKFYQRFEDHCPGEAGKGLNFFFSDELQFGIRGFLWNDHFAAEFKKRKGYEILPELAHLFADLGPRSYKIRLDYNDVMVALSEDGFFKPVYNWHNSRGMLFGCDHGGRGRDVTEFGDYFRTQRWMSGPGCDQPNLGKDIVKAKVASSIAHLYERPRTWLEGYYGSGWGTSSDELADATFTDFAMGHNLLSLHGLYYSTHGSWWEWAAPDNHWRQPYWENMGGFLKCTERLSYILSQGHHRCDVAMVYPVAPTEANLKGKASTETAFSIAKDLYPNGIDFDFMDFESLDRCKIENKELSVSGEKYKVLVLPALSAVRYSTVAKALDFFRSGGIVLAIGSLPEASDRIGGNDPDLQAMIREMFGTTYAENNDTTIVYSKKSKAGGSGLFIHNPLEVKKMVSSLLQPDFKVLTGEIVPGIMHRKIGDRDLYFVYGLPRNSECFFRTTGKAELWNPWNGTTKSLAVSKVSDGGTTLKLPLEKTEPQLIVFSPGKPEMEKLPVNSGEAKVLKMDGYWDFELKPTLDNKYGDYRLPAFDGKLGAEVWEMKYALETSPALNAKDPDFDDHNWSVCKVSFGPQFFRLGPLPSTADSSLLDAQLSVLDKVEVSQPIVLNGKKYYWKPYEFSWRWGLKEDAGHQGYHGLKGQVNNELLSFGTIDKSKKYMPVYSLKAEEGGSVYYLWSNVLSPGLIQAKIHRSGLLPSKVYLNNSMVEADREMVTLKQGRNPLLLRYNKVGRGIFVFENTQFTERSEKPVSLATDWYLNSGILPYVATTQTTNPFGWYRFKTPPGVRSIYITSKAKPEVWVDGKEIACKPGQLEKGRIAEPGLTTWKVELPETLPNSTALAIRIEQLPGFYGGAAIPEPIIFECGKGKILSGDLADVESLRTYSGGMIYGKSITMNASQANSGKVFLNLGKVVSSAELLVNGLKVGTKLTAPWIFDLTGKLKVGENRIEVLIYNTLGNHYLTTPSQYIGRINSGLIGPVNIEFK
ncbi:MAG: glycosyl hydrolase [Prolixibacteraceae bacterium]